MIRILVGALIALAGLFQPAHADAFRPAALMGQAMQRIGVGFRLDFGAPGQGRHVSLALTTTGEFGDREVTLPFLAFDFTPYYTRLGTVVGLRLRPAALEHEVSIYSKLPLIPQFMP